MMILTVYLGPHRGLPTAINTGDAMLAIAFERLGAKAGTQGCRCNGESISMDG